MTAAEAKRNQDHLSKHFNLSWWYGTNCKPCCGVYPKFMTSGATNEKCYFMCEVCGRKSSKEDMPWLAEKTWNEMFENKGKQITEKA